MKREISAPSSNENSQSGPEAFPPLTVTIPSLLAGGSDKQFRELVAALLDIGFQVRELRLFLAAQLGVSEPQYRLVLAIAQLQGDTGVSVGAVAEYLRVSPNFVTMEVRKLEALGRVKKLPNPGDGRGVLLRLSRKGREAFRAVVDTIQLINNTMYGHLSEKEFQTVLKASKSSLRNGQRALDIAHAGNVGSGGQGSAAANSKKKRG